ncbi:MAG: hypothetical protein HKO70_16640, partial [Acidimicrobiia bacterium]|nr:hypothetical protein [Acidimicrobiia bacterium]
YWIPLGAGQRVVRISGAIYEALTAARDRRPRRRLYHAALVVDLPDGTVAIEAAPVPDTDGQARGVVAAGPVGLRWLGRLRIFRYEVRCWTNGVIPDLIYAVTTIPLPLDGPAITRLLESLPEVPTPVWGRDELQTGDMWNSNSVVAWALTRAGLDCRELELPQGGRAPGWHAGRVAADVATRS